MDDDAIRLLCALRRAGCDCFIDCEDQQFYCSPPLRRVEWDSDVEEAIDELYRELRDLMLAEMMRVH
jgi:hypothetical protein